MDALVAIGFWGGFLPSMIAQYVRTGFPDTDADWREFLISNAWWFALMLGKAVLWPITLGVWLYQGRPGTQWRAVTEIRGRPVRRIVRVARATA